MKRRKLISIALTLPWLGACAGTRAPTGEVDSRGVGVVVEYQLSHGAGVKTGISAIADAGYRLFGPSMMNATGGGGTNQLGGATVPRWVRVTWREGVDEAHGLYWTTGTVVGDYTVPVLERIPAEAFALARAGKNRYLILSFRLRDDGVDFAWMIRLQEGAPFERLMNGGDFQAARMRNGKVVEKGWYIDKKTGQKIETDY